MKNTGPMDYATRLVWETEGHRGAAERGWLGEAERARENERQQAEHAEYERERSRRTVPPYVGARPPTPRSSTR